MDEPIFKVTEEKISERYGEFTIEPLQPGYGATLGNALRRVLLTSIVGAAVTFVKINGVRHRFSTLPGLKENIIDLLLNIKELNVRLLDSKESAALTLSVKGPKDVFASDFDGPSDVEIVNKDLYIGSLADKKAKLDMELTIERGYGYSLADERKITTLGAIATDAIFTPVRRVNFEVEATRVGRQTNLDKLILFIWTNGTVTPREALDHAAKILSSYFLQIYEPKVVTSVEGIQVPTAISDELVRMTIDELDLPTRIYNSLRNGGVETVGQLVQTSRKDLISMRNMGGKSIAVIEEKLKEKGIALSA